MLLERWRERLRTRRAELEGRRLLVLCGGGSNEREVSLRSGNAVYAALRKTGLEAALVTLATDNISIDALEGGFANALDAMPRTNVQHLHPQEQQGSLATLGTGQSILSALRSGPALVLSTMHGNLGENGAWQGLLELLDVPFVSAGVKGSALGMDKIITKRLFDQLGVPTPRWWIERCDQSCRDDIGLAVPELVAKPVSEGSSVGVEIVSNDDQGWSKIAALNKRFDPLLIEVRRHGRELTAGVIGPSREPLALPVVEIHPGDHTYSYQAKYSGTSKYECPANTDEATAEQIQGYARQIYAEFDLGPFARIDVLLGPNGELDFLEANTLPGFTEHSLLPMAARAAGIEMGELLELLMLFALERWEQGHMTRGPEART